MTNRPDDDHRGAWDAIPWVVNGRATDAQKRAVEAHASRCDACRDELARQRALHAAMAGPIPGLPGADPAIDRLWARIEEAQREGAAAPPVPARRRAGAGTLAYALAATVLLESVGIAILAVERRHDAAAAPYRTFAQPTAAAAHATLRIVPAPSMTVAELQRLLQDLRLSIVAGPNEAGAFALAPLAQPPSTQTQLARLRDTPGMRFAEPIGPPEGAR